MPCITPILLSTEFMTLFWSRDTQVISGPCNLKGWLCLPRSAKTPDSETTLFKRKETASKSHFVRFQSSPPGLEFRDFSVHHVRFILEGTGRT